MWDRRSMMSVALALMVSTLIFLVGYASASAYLAFTSKMPEEVVLGAPQVQMALERMEAVSEVLEPVVEAASPPPEPEEAGEAGQGAEIMGSEYEAQLRVEMAATLLSIFFNNALVSMAVAYAPLLILIPYKVASLMRGWGSPQNLEKLWMACRAASPIVPVGNLWVNGFIFRALKSISGLHAFMILEILAFILIASVGVEAFLNSRTPESFRKTYKGGITRIFLGMILFLASSALEVEVMFG